MTLIVSQMIVLGKADSNALAGLEPDIFSGNRSLIGVDFSTLQDLYSEYVEHRFPGFTPLTR
jgi:hypothetical protein